MSVVYICLYVLWKIIIIVFVLVLAVSIATFQPGCIV
jgi:hypothetical protein